MKLRCMYPFTVTSVRLVQFWNALICMLVTDYGKVIVVKLEHPKKEYLSMVVTLSGIAETSFKVYLF